MERKEGKERSKRFRWRGLFNWSGETYEFWVAADRAEMAFNLCIVKLSKKLDIPKYAVLSRYAFDQVDNYRLEKGEEVGG